MIDGPLPDLAHRCSAAGEACSAPPPAPSCPPWRIMVDELIQWSHARGMFRAGACHMTTDGPIRVLHDFARKIGLGRHLFHNSKGMPHYDLTEPMRLRALAAGAVMVPWRVQAIARRMARATPTDPRRA